MILGLVMLFVWIITLVGWVIYNLSNKNEKLEGTVIAQANFISSVQALIRESDKSLKELDTKIWMEGDKELQSVFQNMRAMQDALNQFKGQ